MSNDQDFGKQGYYDGFTGDSEKQVRQGSQAPRKMSRLVDGPVTKSITGSIDARAAGDTNGEDVDLSIGKQMEMEAGNAIKYRTCSWQKV